ncbi:hypothetical protein EVAR_80624_1 [Eumeta japonica]|uniref:Transposable element P transposase-like GTP-binding insertion domain-containing protein n=1 Tax=Eumeta variegata TaxID=151549 RepID=A0A4C1ZVL3_EUMVA|nr:hypothetical protein EVAR_80624_1 [Eumeta japonica]
MLLEVDVGEHEIRLVNKLTEQHVNKDKIPKMKVSVAAQVLAKGVGCNEVLANHNILPKECLATAEFL